MIVIREDKPQGLRRRLGTIGLAMLMSRQSVRVYLKGEFRAFGGSTWSHTMKSVKFESSRPPKTETPQRRWTWPICRIRSVDWQRKGSLRASRYNRAVLDQVLLCVLTGTSTQQIGNVQ